MEAKELRIGNWVSHTPSKNETTEANFIVSEINKFSANTINGLYAENCEPIPLTEEWLLKFGFEKVSWNNDFKINLSNSWSLIYDFDVNKLCIDSGLNANYLQTNYVNQLQNLYFALTGEELTLNN
jgi:hypothetical protein